MAQSGYTPISLYYSTTSSAVPTAGNLTNGELAINITDKKLYAKDNAGNVFLLADASSGSTTATNLAGGAAGSLPYQSAANTTTFLAIGAANRVLTSSGTAPQWVTSLTGLTGVSSSSITNTSLTSGRVVYSTTGGAETDSANLTFDGTYLVANSIKDSALTSGRVTYAGASGLLQDSANLTFDGTTLTAAGLATGGSVTLSGGTANGVLYLNGSKVVTSGSTISFDGTTFTSGAHTLSTGNLTFSSTAQRITGDFSNATLVNRVLFQSSTVNGATSVGSIPNGTATTGSFISFNNSDVANSSWVGVFATSTDTQINSNASGTGTQLPLVFRAGGSERVRIDTTGRVGIGATPSVAGVQLTVLGGGTQLSPGTTAQEGVRIQRATGYATLSGINNDNNAYNGLQFFTGASAAVTIDTSGNLALGTTNAGTAGLSISQSLNLSWEQSSTESIANLFRQTSSAALVMSVGYKRSATANGFASSYGSSLAKTAISLGTTAGAITFYTDTAATTAVGTDVTPTERMRIDSSGNVGIGTASPSSRLEVTGANVIVKSTASSGYGSFYANGATGNAAFYFFAINSTETARIASDATNILTFATGNAGTERMRIDSSGNVGIGTASPSKLLQVANNATNVEALFSSTANVYSYLTLNTWALDRAQIRAEAVNPGAGSGTGSGKLTFFTARNPTMTEAMSLDGSGYMTCLGVYNATVGATNRDVYVDNTGLIGYVSSIRASKTNIAPLSDTNWLLQLQPVTFNYRAKDEDGKYTDTPDGPQQYGLIAEDVEAVAPDLCYYDEVEGQQELRGINYSRLITPLLKLVQDQQSLINDLTARVRALEAKG